MNQARIRSRSPASSRNLLINLVRRLPIASGQLASVGIGVLVVAVFVNVVARYAFRHSIEVIDATTSYMLVFLSAFAMAYTMRQQRHVHIDILTLHLPRKAADWLRLLALLLTLIYLGIIIWQSSKLALDAFGTGTHSDSFPALPLGPILLFIPVGLVIFALEVIYQIKKQISETLSDRKRHI